MLNIGIIGNTEVLEPHVKLIQKNKNVNVIGKASVGTSAQLNSFHFSIPEFNRVELIERADILLVDDSSLLPFDLLCAVVKKGKHIFATEYLNLSMEECRQLVKLSHESGSVVQVSNPHFYTPAIHWLNDNFSAPLFLEISKFSEKGSNNEAVYPLLLMLIGITGLNPKKVGAMLFSSENGVSNFTNIRLEYGNASVVNMNIGSQITKDKFKVKVYSKDRFVSIDFTEEVFLFNNEEIDFSSYLSVNEFDAFVDSIQTRNQSNSNLEEYLSSMILLQSITQKISKFIS